MNYLLLDLLAIHLVLNFTSVLFSPVSVLRDLFVKKCQSLLFALFTSLSLYPLENLVVEVLLRHHITNLLVKRSQF
jgi:hypothetical protein